MSRREVFSSVAPPLAVAAFSSTQLLADDADVELIELFSEWRRSAEAEDFAYEQEVSLFDLFERAPIPAPLFRKDSDFSLFYGFTGETCRYEEGAGRLWYGDASDLATLKAWRFPEYLSDEYKAKTQDRIKEIIESSDWWHAENQVRRENCGLAAAEALSEQINQQNRAIRARIISAQAHTLRGLAIKAAVFGWCRHSTSQEVRTEAESDARDGNLTDMTVLMSLAADALNLAEAQGRAVLAAA